ncbi:MAG TPA: hypothetical protein ENJ18_10080 [Nannocystis exedens]|nr:hypothetical protein [Nannocystis exedens]
MTQTHTLSSDDRNPSFFGRRLAQRATLALGLGALTLSAVGCDEASADSIDDESMIEERLAALESKEEIRTTMLKFSQVLDAADIEGLKALEPRFQEDIELNAIDFDGTSHHYVGMQELVDGYMPILVSSPPTLSPSAIDVEIDGDTATAYFKFTTSIVPPPQLGLGTDQTLMLFAANSIDFAYEDDTWKISSITLAHSLAYPGSLMAP